MAGLKNDKDKEKDKTVSAEPKEITNNTETNVNIETGNTEVVTQNQEATEVKTDVNIETGNTEAVTQNQVTAEVKTEKNEAKKEDKTYIYMGEELTKDGFILKHKGFYTSEQLSRIETGISDYDEIKENFIDLDEYSENR